MARVTGKRKRKLSLAIIGEGLTEQIYFDRLKYHETIPNFQIKPDLPITSSFKGILEKADGLIDEGFDRVYALIDLDKIIEDGQEKNLQKELKEREEQIKSSQLNIIICNPCFEIWFLLHYKETAKNFNSSKELLTDLKKHIDDYEKSKKYLTRKDIYKILRPNLKDKAIPNSKKTERVNNRGKKAAMCQVHKIIEDLDYL